MKKERKDKHFIKKPIYPGGLKAMRAFIAKHKKYPPAAEENNIEGVVRVKYDIDYKGNVVGTQVQSSLGYGCDEEALRAVKSTAVKWSPAQKDGKAVNQKIVLPITFTQE